MISIDGRNIAEITMKYLPPTRDKKPGWNLGIFSNSDEEKIVTRLLLSRGFIRGKQ